MDDEYKNQPPISEWKFINELTSPLHSAINWRRTKRNAGEVSLKEGVRLEFNFPDGSGKLDTAYEDFRKFLASGQIGMDGDYRIITSLTATSCFEEYLLDINQFYCNIQANDTEGIRRGLVYLEDRITGTGGPFIKTGQFRRTPFIKTRISRCFFGPIKRPPMNRDELMDDVNYYPDEYLNRLAHECVNGLWLSIRFRDFPSRFFPEHGGDSEKRLEKLRATVKQCARYGIKIYLFCIEPMAFSEKDDHYLPMAALKTNPACKGHEASGMVHFCTSSAEGQEYIEACTDYIFSRVPDLGGMICIVNGERFTNCYSTPSSFFGNNCPRCSTRKPWEVYGDTLAAFVRGMKKSTPQAEFIAWFYTPMIMDDAMSTKEQKFEIFREIAAHAPRDVVMQMNFESNGLVRQLGRELTAYDYWLAYPGPSGIFRDWASAARQKTQARVSAKIQVGCSHENATIPFMPVPGSLYRKYRSMQELGVSSVMQCWYFGNYPGLMNKAAGELSFLPLATDENKFLKDLAMIDWSGHQKQVAQAWKYFFKGYSCFPISLTFTWYGPLHSSIVWPLHLFPVDQPIAPSWKFGFPDSGDRIGECISFTHKREEVLTQLSLMNESWQKGTAIMAALENDYAGNRARLMDIGLCKAIGLQINSALDVFTFYVLREKLPFCEKNEQLAILENMQGIVRKEIDHCRLMRALCLQDSRLGFHSEAEGYKFFPSKLVWRMEQLESLLQNEFPKVRSQISEGKDLFPEYTGVQFSGKTYFCEKSKTRAAEERFYDDTGSWKAWHDRTYVYFEVNCTEKAGDQDLISLIIEPRRLDPAMKLSLSAAGKITSPYLDMSGWDGKVINNDCGWTASFKVPFHAIPWYERYQPLRVNVCRCNPENGTRSGWIELHPLPKRLVFDDHNSADLGFMFFNES